MRYKNLKLSVMLLLGLGLSGLQAQETVTASGGNASGSGGSTSYTVGQVVYNTIANSNGSVAQGVQQPFEISVVTAIEEAKDINLIVSAYPNPTTNCLTLKIEDNLQMQYIVSLIDINGKLLENKKTEGIETTISMKNLVPATYFLKVIKSNKEVKTFKIIKN
ncbi:MAG: T9SS type A sorting domain-containing protein [Bacteroidales bacterium]